MSLILAWLLVSCGDVAGPCWDVDGDGFTTCGAIADCNDLLEEVHPGARELCDGLDDDCNGALMDAESDADADGARVCDGDCDDSDPDRNTADWDGDGWTSCEGDCDDSSLLVYPGAIELCDGADGDCDGVVDDEIAVATWYEDADGDGWGADSTGVDACARPSLAYVSRAGDCDDADASVYPLADEVCDGVDNDCDGAIDPGCPP